MQTSNYCYLQMSNYGIFAKLSQLDISKPTRLPPYCLLTLYQLLNAISKPTYLLTLNWRHKRLCIRIGHYGAIQMLYYYYYYYYYYYVKPPVFTVSQRYIRKITPLDQ